MYVLSATQRLMVMVYRRGPEMSGIMRRGNNALLQKEIREKISSGLPFTMEEHQAPTAASVFKVRFQIPP